MTVQLERAVEKSAALPADKQDRLAEIMLDALDDMEWDRKFAASQDFLETLADEGLADYEAVKPKPGK